MIKLIRNFLLNRISAKNSPSTYKGWEKVKTVSVLFEVEKENQIINTLKDALIREGKEVTFLTFVSTKRPKENAMQNAYYKTDVNLFGKPKKMVFEMIDLNTDVLINWVLDDSSSNNFIAASSSSSFKIGIGNSLSCYNLEIKNDLKNPQKVIDEILKYLKMINHD